MCCFSELVEEGGGRHGFAALFTSLHTPGCSAPTHGLAQLGCCTLMILSPATGLLCSVWSAWVWLGSSHLTHLLFFPGMEAVPSAVPPAILLLSKLGGSWDVGCSNVCKPSAALRLSTHPAQQSSDMVYARLCMQGWVCKAGYWTHGMDTCKRIGAHGWVCMAACAWPGVHAECTCLHIAGHAL